MSQTTLFKHKLSAEEGGLNQTGLTTLIGKLRTQASGKFGNGFVDQGVSRNMMGMESINDADLKNLISEADRLSVSMESIVNDVASTLSGSGAKLFSRVQKDAAIGIGMLGGALKDMIQRPLVAEFTPADANTTFIPANGGDMMSTRMKPALEAFDEKENQNAVLYSVAYNMTAARQDEFGEAFFPTVIVTPDQIGFSVSIRIHNVMSDLRRSTSGELDKWNKRNIIQAVIDPSIFNTDNTRIVPVVRDDSVSKFVAAADVAPKNAIVGEETVSTAPLKIGAKLSLIGISQTEATLATGMMGVSDAVDSAVTLSAIYVKLGTGSNTDVFKFDTKRLPFAVWNRAPQGNYRALSLNFSNSTLSITKAKPTNSGAAKKALTDVVIGDYQVRLSVSLFGNLNQELGDTEVNAGSVTVASIIGPDSEPLPLDGAEAATIIAALGDAKVIGYDLDCQRVNSDRRQRGQLLDTTFYNQIYAVPLRSPLTILRPTNITDETDAADLSALITATHIRTSNEAVKTLLEAAQMLAEYVDPRNTFEQAPAILGVARDLVKATYVRRELDLTKIIQSLTSADRFDNIQNAMYNVIRDHVYNVYRDSGYQAAANALAGGVAVPPTVIIGTDPVIARYLMVSGDTRTLGEGFPNVKIVTTLNKTMIGKLFVTFGNFAAGKEGIPDPMHFGNMAWKPEATLVLPILRNGAYTKELTVQPSFLHIVNLPILIELDVKGITEVATGKVSLEIDGQVEVTGGEIVTHEGEPVTP